MIFFQVFRTSILRKWLLTPKSCIIFHKKEKNTIIKPIVQIIRFQEQDVIATSGGGTPVGAYSLSTRIGDYYGCLRTEADEARMNYDEKYSSHQFVYFHYNASTSQFIDAQTAYALYSGDHYAWYSNGQWWTENKDVSEYGYNLKSTANWRTQ